MSYIHLRQTVYTEDGSVFLGGYFVFRFYGTLSPPAGFTPTDLNALVSVGERAKVHSRGLILW